MFKEGLGSFTDTKAKIFAEGGPQLKFCLSSMMTCDMKKKKKEDEEERRRRRRRLKQLSICFLFMLDNSTDFRFHGGYVYQRWRAQVF